MRETIALIPAEKGKAILWLYAELNTRQKVLKREKLSIELPPVGHLPEFHAGVVVSESAIWVLDPSSQKYREVSPRHIALRWLIDKLSPLFKRGTTGLLYTDNELIHRACRLWLQGRTKNKRFLRRLAELLLAGKEKEARALLISKEL